MRACDGLSPILARLSSSGAPSFSRPLQKGQPRNFGKTSNRGSGKRVTEDPGNEVGLPPRLLGQKYFIDEIRATVNSESETKLLCIQMKVGLCFAIVYNLRFSCLYCLFYLYHNCICILLHFLRDYFKYLGNYQYGQVVWEESA